MSWRQDDPTRDGFTCAYGRFYTAEGRIDRVDGASLQRMFLPKMTPEGKKMLRDHRHFVRGQLQHYGVSFDESKVSSNGTTLLKKALQAGKCDAVPAHILALQEQLHREWLETQTDEYLVTKPAWFMDKYFLRGVDGGRQPDRTKTTTVIGVPLPRHSEYRAGNMREAADNVAGLYHETGKGPETQTIFMGWDSAAVKAAAAGHAAKEKKKLQEQEKKRQEQEKERTVERAKVHEDYLRSQKAKKSPVGSYIVDCKAIESEWPDTADDLTLDIHDTDEPGVFQACFDFGILQGVMVIGTDETILEEYCSKADRGASRYYLDEDAGADDKEEDDKPKAGSKRKTPSSSQHSRGPKKAKAGRPRSTLTYQLKSRSRETGEGEIYADPEDGTIKFQNGNLAAFDGKAALPCVGREVSFTARKISDMPCSRMEEWADYSEEAYGRACVSRWH